MTPEIMPISLEDKCFAEGNWHPFPPPPGEGTYDFRQIVGSDGGPYRAYFYGLRRVYQGKGSRWMTMGRRISKMEAKQGWQFRFLQSRSNWRPQAVIYDTTTQPYTRAGTRDLTGQLPLARSIEEARYLVASIPSRYPMFWHMHVEFSEEKLQ